MPSKRGTTREVIVAFLHGQERRTVAASVAGGHRVRSEPSQDEPGAFDLFSYQTVIARRHPSGEVSTSPRKYSRTTSKLQGFLARALDLEGFAPSGESRSIRAKVPGRWGGFGPAWHPTGTEELPFIHHTQDLDRRAVRQERANAYERTHWGVGTGGFLFRHIQEAEANYHPTDRPDETERETAHKKLRRSSGFSNWMRKRREMRDLLLTERVEPKTPPKETHRDIIVEQIANAELEQTISEEKNLEQRRALTKDRSKPFLFRTHRYLPSMHEKGKGSTPLEPGAYTKAEGSGIVDMRQRHAKELKN